MSRAYQRPLWSPSTAVSALTGETLEQVQKRADRHKLEDSLAAEFRLFGIPTPHREFFFHPERKWRSDFCWPDRKIIVEVQGGLFIRNRGGHNRGAHIELDYEKINEAQRMGYRVFQFGPKAVRRPAGGMRASAAIEFLYPIFMGTTLAEARGLPKQIDDF